MSDSFKESLYIYSVYKNLPRNDRNYVILKKDYFSPSADTFLKINDVDEYYVFTF